MSWVKTYESFVFETKSDAEVEKLEKLLKLPANSGVINSVEYDKTNKTLIIEEPSDIGAMDSGAILASIKQEKQKIKRSYPGVKTVAIGDLQITI
jgi:hypothetical protein